MTNEDVNKITKALDNKLKPLIGEVARVKTELSESRMTQARQYVELSRIGKDIARIDATLETINEELGKHTKILNGHTKTLDEHSEKLNALWEQTIKVTLELVEVKEISDSHTVVLKTIEETNSQDIKKVDKRLTSVENQMGIIPPPELTIPE